MLDYQELPRRAGPTSESRAATWASGSRCTWSRRRWRIAGLGATDSATIRIDPSGRVQALTGVNSQGHSVETTMAQVIADQLGVDDGRRQCSCGATPTPSPSGHAPVAAATPSSGAERP